MALKRAMLAGRKVLDNVKAFVAGHDAGPLGAQGAYDALNAAIASVRAVMAQYQISGG